MDVAGRIRVEGVLDAVEHQVGQHLRQGARVAIEHDVRRAIDVDGDARLFQGRLQAGNHFANIIAQFEQPARLADLVDGDLLEAVDQVCSAVGIVHDQPRTLAGRLQVAHDVGFLHGAARHGRADGVRGFLQHRGAGQRNADRGIDFMRDAGHQTAQRSQPFRLQQRLLRAAQVIHRLRRLLLRAARHVFRLTDAGDDGLELALHGVEATDHVTQFIAAVFRQLFDVVAAARGQVEQTVAQLFQRVKDDAQAQRQRTHENDVKQQNFHHLAPHFAAQGRIDLFAAEIDDDLAHDHGLAAGSGRHGVTEHERRLDGRAAHGHVRFERYQGAGGVAHLPREQAHGSIVDADADQFRRQHFGRDDAVDLGFIEVPQGRRQARLQARQHAAAQARAARFQFLAQCILGIAAGNAQHQSDDHDKKQSQPDLDTHHQSTLPGPAAGPRRGRRDGSNATA